MYEGMKKSFLIDKLRFKFPQRVGEVMQPIAEQLERIDARYGTDCAFVEVAMLRGRNELFADSMLNLLQRLRNVCFKRLNFLFELLLISFHAECRSDADHRLESAE